MRVAGLAILAVLAACGGDDDGGAGGGGDASPEAPDACAAPPGAPAIVYLNLGGGTYGPGPESSVDDTTDLTEVEREVPPHPYGGDADDRLVDCVTAGLTPFHIETTLEDPGAVDHTEVVFTAESWLGDIGAASAFSCAGYPRGIAFVFGESFSSDVPGECAAALRQLGSLTAGLDHVIGCDYMNLDDDCGELSWRDEDLPCGDDAERACTCGGTTQNSYQKLLATFGPRCL